MRPKTSIAVLALVLIAACGAVAFAAEPAGNDALIFHQAKVTPA